MARDLLRQEGPTFTPEKSLQKDFLEGGLDLVQESFKRTKGFKIAGVDEAGRGPLAGPVVAAAVIFPSFKLSSVLKEELNDSKKLSEATRERLFDVIRAEALYGIGEASVEEIDDINILQATYLAFKRALDNLPAPPEAVLIDGNRAPALSWPSRTLVKGDQKSLSIAAASILAKVYRDRKMKAADEIYGAYGFARHKGYGTKEHLNALRVLGASAFHRQSFRPVREVGVKQQD